MILNKERYEELNIFAKLSYQFLLDFRLELDLLELKLARSFFPETLKNSLNRLEPFCQSSNGLEPILIKWSVATLDAPLEMQVYLEPSV